MCHSDLHHETYLSKGESTEWLYQLLCYIILEAYKSLKTEWDTKQNERVLKDNYLKCKNFED